MDGSMRKLKYHIGEMAEWRENKLLYFLSGLLSRQSNRLVVVSLGEQTKGGNQV